MKKMISILVAFGMMLSLAGCGEPNISTVYENGSTLIQVLNEKYHEVYPIKDINESTSVFEVSVEQCYRDIAKWAEEDGHEVKGYIEDYVICKGDWAGKSEEDKSVVLQLLIPFPQSITKARLEEYSEREYYAKLLIDRFCPGYADVIMEKLGCYEESDSGYNHWEINYGKVGFSYSTQGTLPEYSERIIISPIFEANRKWFEENSK